MKFDSSVLTNIKNKYEDMEKRNDYLYEHYIANSQNLELLYDLIKSSTRRDDLLLDYVEWYEFTKMAFYKYKLGVLTKDKAYTFEQWISRQVQVLNEY